MLSYSTPSAFRFGVPVSSLAISSPAISKLRTLRRISSASELVISSSASLMRVVVPTSRSSSPSRLTEPGPLVRSSAMAPPAPAFGVLSVRQFHDILRKATKAGSERCSLSLLASSRMRLPELRTWKTLNFSGSFCLLG